MSVPDLTRRAAKHGASAAITLSPHHGDVREFYGEVVAAAGSMPVLAYHFPQVSAPGITIEELKALKVAGIKDSTGDCERLLDTLALPQADLHGQLVDRRVGRDARAHRRHPRRGQPRAELCVDAFAGSVAAQKDLLGAHQILSQLRREGHQGGAGPPLGTLHRLPVRRY